MGEPFCLFKKRLSKSLGNLTGFCQMFLSHFIQEKHEYVFNQETKVAEEPLRKDVPATGQGIKKASAATH